MKKTICLPIVVISLLFTTLTFGQNPNPLYQHLPPSANHVYSIKIGQILAKGNLISVLNSIPPTKDPKAAVAINIIKDPSSAGIDLNQDVLIAQTTAGGSGADTVSFTQILVQLTDSAKFRATLNGATNDLHFHRVPGKATTATKDKAGLAWNDHLLVITLASAHLPHSEGTVEKSLAALAGFSGTTWLTDQRFLSGFATDADMHAWSARMDMMSLFSKFAAKLAAKNPAMQGAMQGKPLPDYSGLAKMPHPPVLSTFSFENGRIVFKVTMFNAPEDASFYPRLYDRPFNKDLLARVPNNGLLLGVAAAHINLAVLPEAMDKYGTRHMIDSILGKKGLTISDITAAFGGDFLVAALGDTTAATETTKKKVNFYFVATLGDPGKIMQLASKLTANNGGTTMDSTASAKLAKMKKLAEKIVVQDNILVISGSKELAQQYFANHDRRSTDILGDNNSIQHITIDLKAVSSFMGHSMSSDPKAMVAARILEKLDKIDFSNGLPDGNNMSMTFQIVTAEPSTNSLATLMSILH
jgi:hypothetical protein